MVKRLKSALAILCLAFGLSAALPTLANDSPPVKKSNSGICHAQGTTYYAQTKYFTPYATLEACLKSGGRLPKR